MATFGGWLTVIGLVLVILLVMFLERLPAQRDVVVTWPTIPDSVGSPLLILALVGVIVGSVLFVGC